MKPFNWICGVWILVMAEAFAASPKLASHDLDAAIQAKVQAAYGGLPLGFEVNQGQVDKKVKFLSRGSGYSLFLTSTEAVLQLWSVDFGMGNEKTGRVMTKANNPQSAIHNPKSATLRMKLLGSHPAPEVTGQQELPSKSHYFAGTDPSQWRTNLPNYAKVRYKDVYPGIDLVFYGNQGKLEYDFIVAPGADPRTIRLRFEGASRPRLAPNGNLLLDSTKGRSPIQLRKPVVYQEASPSRTEIKSAYVLNKSQIGFRVGAYNPAKPLVIDPVIIYDLVTDQEVRGIAVDPAGSSYITQASSRGFVVAKLNAGTLVYSTYLGSENDIPFSIAVDSTGNAYVSGVTKSTNFPVVSALQPASGGGADAFVTKLDPSGSALVYSTYLGGSGSDEGRSIAVDSSGSVYLTGDTHSTDFPTMNAAQPAFGGTDNPFWGDAFVAKLNPAGSARVYSTYLGGSGGELGSGIGVDGASNVYVTGSTASTNFPTLNPLQPARGGCSAANYSVAPILPWRCSDAFVTKLDAAGQLVYSTYLGGSSPEDGNDIAVDVSGNAYVAGETTSPDFPTASPMQPALHGDGAGRDAFVAKLSPAGRFVYSTYLGGDRDDSASSIAVDASGNAYVSGDTSSTDFPTVNALQGNEVLLAVCDESVPSGFVPRTFLLKLNPAGSALSFSTYLSAGGADSCGESGEAVAVDRSGSVHLAVTVQGGWATSYNRVARIFDELSLFVPLVLSFSGVNNSFFTSELTLTNRSAKDVTLNFAYTAIVGDGSGTASDTLPPGRQRIVPDAIAYLKSLGIPIPDSGNHAGSLVVRFSGLSSPSEGTVLVRTTTPVPDGRAGLDYGGIPTSATLSGPAYICGLRQNATDRTNLAIHNTGTPSEGIITLRLTVFSGNPTAPSSVGLPDVILFPGGFYQINNILQSNGLSLNSGYVRVERVSGTAPYYAYALIHDQANTDGVVVGPVRESSLAGRTGLTLPVIVETSTLSSELVLTNWSASKKSLRFALVAEGIQTQGSSANFVIELNAREQMILPNFVQWLRQRDVSGLGSASEPHVGPLYVTVEGGDVDGIFLGARTSRPGRWGRYNSFYAAVPHGMASTASTWLYGLQQNAETRTNLALVNTGDTNSAPNAFTVELFDGETGVKVNTIEGITLKARSWMQFESLLARYAAGITQAYARVTRTGGSNAFITYAVISDGGQPGERSGDTAFVFSSP